MGKQVLLTKWLAHGINKNAINKNTKNKTKRKVKEHKNNVNTIYQNNQMTFNR